MTILLMFVLLSACATAKRGSSEVLTFQTVPEGAAVTTSVPLKTPRIKRGEYAKIQAGEASPPDIEFFSCEPTPCEIEMDRKTEFDILVTKQGHAAYTAPVDFFHRKKIAAGIKRETALATALAAGTAGAITAGSVAAGVSLASFGTASASTGMVVGSAAIVAAPVVGIGLISMGVDASTGANYDYWPNPANITLEAIDTSPEAEAVSDAVIEEFKRTRVEAAIRPYNQAALRDIKAKRQEAREDRLANDRIFQDYVESTTEEDENQDAP